MHVWQLIKIHIKIMFKLTLYIYEFINFCPPTIVVETKRFTFPYIWLSDMFWRRPKVESSCHHYVYSEIATFLLMNYVFSLDQRSSLIVISMRNSELRTQKSVNIPGNLKRNLFFKQTLQDLIGRHLYMCLAFDKNTH